MPRPFRSVTPAYRESLRAQVTAIQRAVTPSVARARRRSAASREGDLERCCKEPPP